jgi:hypothetical protein
MYIGLDVKYLLFFSDFNETLTSSTDFRKLLKSHFMKISPVGVKLFHAGGYTYRRTDRHDKADGSYLQFCERA